MTDASDATIFDTEALFEIRQRLRRERQARVGILRNPNHPPKPPTRRAALTGKWLNLRSSRRPRAAPGESGDQAPAVTANRPAPVYPPVADSDGSPLEGSGQVAAHPAVQTAADGQVLSVDVAGLMASVDAHAGIRTTRTRYAAEYRHEPIHQRRSGDQPVRRDSASPPVPSPASAQRPGILTPEAWLDGRVDQEHAEGAQGAQAAATQPNLRRRRAFGPGWRVVLRLLASMLGGMVLAVLILLALLGPPP